MSFILEKITHHTFFLFEQRRKEIHQRIGILDTFWILLYIKCWIYVYVFKRLYLNRRPGMKNAGNFDHKLNDTWKEPLAISIVLENVLAACCVLRVTWTILVGLVLVIKMKVLSPYRIHSNGPCTKCSFDCLSLSI